MVNESYTTKLEQVPNFQMAQLGWVFLKHKKRKKLKYTQIIDHNGHIMFYVQG